MAKSSSTGAKQQAGTDQEQAPNAAAVDILIDLLRGSDAPKDLVTIVSKNGSKESKFSIHKEFACRASPVLKAAFESSFVEGQTQTYKLDVSEDVIRALVRWIYTQDFKSVQITTGKFDQAEAMTLVQLWVLADKLLMPKLQNMLIREIDKARKTTKIIPTCCFQYVWENTAEESPLRILFIHECAMHIDSGWNKKLLSTFPHEMLQELIIAMSNSKIWKSYDLQNHFPLSYKWSRYEVQE
ncbi:hypothetical protein EG329_011516 [Mollisiaceae sp. DMI_Dod_QoI]|nr:hypothetical protein EG329_011516 [Helotiales sp. DMI_Dod_QoI]